MGVAERREREREERRQRILDAAEKVFFDRGAVHATMDEVAQAAELSKGTLYLYFDSKDALYMGIAIRTLTVLVERAESLPDGPSGLVTLARFFELQRTFVLEYPDRFRSLLAWSAAGFRAERGSPAYDEYRGLSNRIFGRVVTCLEAGQRDGSIRAELDPPSTTIHLWGAATGVCMMYFNQSEIAARLPTPVDFDGLLAGLSDMLLRSVRTVDVGPVLSFDCREAARGKHV